MIGKALTRRLCSVRVPSSSSHPLTSVRTLLNLSQPQTQSHSSQLSDSSYLYEYTRHYYHPGQANEFFEAYEQYVNAVKSKSDGVELVGSFQGMSGDEDQAIHIYRYKRGFANLDEMNQMKMTDPTARQLHSDIGKLCRRRRAVVMRAFSYWGDPQPRDPSHVYDLRSYVLKPGQMIEWANNWVKGITYRRDHNQDVGGWFSQIGQLYCVYHLWAYKSLEARANVRDHTWSKPGWDRTVQYTVPLIRTMQSKIMLPTKYSPLK